MMWKLHDKTQRTIRLILFTFTYLIFGAFMFGFFEHDADMELRDKIKQTRDKLQLKYNFTKDDFNRLETTIIKSIMFRGGLKWNFLGSLFFSIIVITTIGYGHSTPNSFLGKLFYIIFALFGIPLGLITFQSTGERLNYGLRCFLVKLRSLLAKFGINMLQDIKARHLLVLSLTLGTLIIAIGTIVFHKKETWCLFDSFYFCVITFTTIGLGDRVAAQTDNRLESDVGYVIFTLLFILIGLAVFSACVNLLILEFMASNADIITTRTHIKRLLQRSASLKSATFNSFSSLTTRSHRSSHSLKPLHAQKNDSNTGSTYVYYRRNQINFSIKRPASIYIDHLVHTQTSRL